MVKVKNSSSVAPRRVIFWLASIALFAGFTIVVLEKAHITNFYNKPKPTSVTPATTQSTRPVNSVDYSPAKPGEQPDPSTKTQDTNTQNPTQSTNSNSQINIVLSAAGQDTNGGPVVVAALINGATGGNCAISLTNGTTGKSYSALITWEGTYYSCRYTVPYSDVSVGQWTLNVVATQGTVNGTVSKVITVQGP